MAERPFKFLDSYTRDDAAIFFGRDKEIEEVYTKVFQSKLLLVYGVSGSGKSSLVNCGLSSRFQRTDWLPINVRRRSNITQDIIEAASAFCTTPLSGKQTIRKALRSVYLDQFMPVYLILDQLEELFIFGDQEEIDTFVEQLSKVLSSDINAKVVLIIREEFLAQLTAWEERIPELFENRARLEKMSWRNAVQAIEGPCAKFDITLEEGFAERLLGNIGAGRSEVELTYLQVYLDRVYESMRGAGSNTFSNALLDRIGPVGDVLASFLDEQVGTFPDPEAALTVLKSFVSNRGTKRLIGLPEVAQFAQEIGKPLSLEKVQEIVVRAVNLRILKDQDDQGRYELRHDSLAATIYAKISLFEKELIDIRQFIDQAYASHLKRRTLLTKEDLNYIAPYEDKLFLAKEQRTFIAASRKEIGRRSRRRLTIGITLASLVVLALTALSLWALREKDVAERAELEATRARDKALTAEQEAERQRTFAVSSRDSLNILFKELKEAYEQGDMARVEALKSRQEALESKVAEEQERRIAEQRRQEAEESLVQKEEALDEAERANVEKERVNRLAKAGQIALNSLEVRDDPDLRGAMAIQALRFMERNGGDLQDEALIRALRTALLNLELKDPARIPLRTTAKSAMDAPGGGLLVLDKEGRLTRLDPAARTSTTLSTAPSPVSGLDNGFLAPEQGLVLWARSDGGLQIWPNSGGSIRSSTSRTDHLDQVTAMASFADGQAFLSGDRKGRLITWEVDGPTLAATQTKDIGGIVRGMAWIPGPDLVATINKTATVHLVSRNGTVRTVALPAGEQAQRIAVDGRGQRCYVGTGKGSVYRIDVTKGTATKVGGGAQGIEAMTVRADGNRVAFVNAAKRLTVLDPSSGSRTLNMDLEDMPSALMFGAEEELYLVSGLKVERTYCTSAAFAQRICSLLSDRALTPEEWEKRIGIGEFEVPCR